MIGLDATSGGGHRHRHQIDEALDPVRAARRHVECRGEVSFVIKNWCRRAAQQYVAGEEMFIPVNGQRTLLDDAGPDAVSPLALFAPDGPLPQPP